MPFTKPILDEVYPDRLWANNLAVLLRWKDEEKLLKMKDHSIYYLDVDHPYIAPFYAKFGLDIIELASASLMNTLDTIHRGKKIAAFHFAHIKIKIKQDSNIRLHKVTTAHENKPLTFNAVILAVARRQAYPVSGTFVCPICYSEERGNADSRRVLKPLVCLNPSCKRAKMELKEGSTVSQLVQDIVLQEPIEEIVENQPVDIDAKLIDIDVGHTYMGQKKKITAIFRVDYDTKGKQKDIYMDILTVKDLDDVELIMPKPEDLQEWMNRDDEGLIDDIIGSFAPHIFGYRNIKLALILSIVSKRGRIHERRRGWINALLVGDPGMAKSMLLEEVEKVTQKSTFTTGKGSTAAGLTAGMVKRDNGTSVLQAGTYPLSHRGVAIVDEFDKMNKDDMGIMHEVMEQGKVSRSVAGKNVSLPAMAVTLAAANPRFGNYDDSLTLMENIDLPTPILTRFDLIFLIKDKVDSIMDAKKADKVLEDFGSGTKEKKTYMTSKQLTSYLNYVQTLEVELTVPAQFKLKKIYEKLRNISKEKNSIPVTPRTLESLGRLAMSYAKLLFKTKADESDVVAVYELFKESYHSFGKELEETGSQLTLIKSDKLNKEQQWTKAWKKCENDKGYVDEKDLYELLELEFNWERKQSMNKFSQTYNSGLIRKCANGRYRWSE
jgi:replicative DNA helicase Mcm